MFISFFGNIGEVANIVLDSNTKVTRPIRLTIIAGRFFMTQIAQQITCA